MREKPLDAVDYLIILSVVIIFAVALMILLPLRSFVVVFIHPQLQAGDKSRMEGSPSENLGWEGSKICLRSFIPAVSRWDDMKAMGKSWGNGLL